jgi:hypothetical protein
MQSIEIDISPAQMKRLHKGHKVRVKKGRGFELMVHPTTYNIVSRAFNKGKGSQIQLTPEEIKLNEQGVTPEDHAMTGKGWGDLEESISNNLARLANAGANTVVNRYLDEEEPKTGKGVCRTGRRKGKGWGDLEESISNNLARLANAGANTVVNRYLDEEPKTGKGIGDIMSQNALFNNLNKHLDTNYGYMSRAGLDNAMSSNKNAMLAKMAIDARYKMAPTVMPSYEMGPQSRSVGGRLENGTIGRNGGMMSSYTPPALVSQPFSANFQFQHFLPPQYQHFNMGGSYDAMGNGLYA